MKAFLIIQVAIICLARFGQGAVIQIEPELQINPEQTSFNSHTGPNLQINPEQTSLSNQRQSRMLDGDQTINEMMSSDSSMVEVRMFPSPDHPEQSGKVTSSVRRVSATVGISEVVGNSTRSVSVSSDVKKPEVLRKDFQNNDTKRSDVRHNDIKRNDIGRNDIKRNDVGRNDVQEEEKPFIAINFDDLDDRPLSAPSTSTSTTTTTTATTSTTTMTTTTTPTVTTSRTTASTTTLQQRSNFVIKQV
jgi:hypothetical protein